MQIWNDWSLCFWGTKSCTCWEVNIPWFIGYHSSQMGQDFVHPQQEYPCRADLGVDLYLMRVSASLTNEVLSHLPCKYDVILSFFVPIGSIGLIYLPSYRVNVGKYIIHGSFLQGDATKYCPQKNGGTYDSPSHSWWCDSPTDPSSVQSRYNPPPKILLPPGTQRLHLVKTPDSMKILNFSFNSPNFPPSYRSQTSKKSMLTLSTNLFQCSEVHPNISPESSPT